MAHHRVLSIRLDEGLFGLRPRVAETWIEAHVPELLRCRLGGAGHAMASIRGVVVSTAP